MSSIVANLDIADVTLREEVRLDKHVSSLKSHFAERVMVVSSTLKNLESSSAKLNLVE